MSFSLSCASAAASCRKSNPPRDRSADIPRAARADWSRAAVDLVRRVLPQLAIAGIAVTQRGEVRARVVIAALGLAVIAPRRARTLRHERKTHAALLTALGPQRRLPCIRRRECGCEDAIARESELMRVDLADEGA